MTPYWSYDLIYTSSPTLASFWSILSTIFLVTTVPPSLSTLCFASIISWSFTLSLLIFFTSLRVSIASLVILDTNSSASCWAFFRIDWRSFSILLSLSWSSLFSLLTLANACFNSIFLASTSFDCFSNLNINFLISSSEVIVIFLAFLIISSFKPNFLAILKALLDPLTPSKRWYVGDKVFWSNSIDALTILGSSKAKAFNCE